MLTATDVSICLNSGVKRACGLVSPSTCSANVAAAHLAFMHLKRRIVTAKTVLIPLSAAGASRRTYRSCTRPDATPQCGQTPSSARQRA
jgi:hypothetical protein